jgi:hypothetical protein
MPRRSKQKTPKRGQNPSIKKEVRKSFDYIDFKNENPAWQINTIDTGGEWGWHKITNYDIEREVYPKLKSFETMTWHEIERGGSHSQPINSLCPDAQKRLRELQNEDIDELFSLRLTGKKRIWGIIDRNILKILWWDPDHTICPSDKKYT